MRKLMLFIIALMAVVTFIRAFDIAVPETAALPASVEKTAAED